MTAGHTPVPWRGCKDCECPCGAIWDGSGEIHLATVFDETALGMDCFGSDIGVSRAERIANARFICRAVNAHDELVDALQAICEMQERHYGDGMRTHMALIDLSDNARTALSKALGNDGGEG